MSFQNGRAKERPRPWPRHMSRPGHPDWRDDIRTILTELLAPVTERLRALEEAAAGEGTSPSLPSPPPPEGPIVTPEATPEVTLTKEQRD